jgi:primosomal protein N' (replication factor Y) (superfamily II helicase)
MRAEVLMPRASWRLTDRASLYSYSVPAHLLDQAQPGQLVAVPFGERETAGVIWSLDASDDAGDTGDIVGDDENFPLRAISSLLLDEPALSLVQRTLAEWMSAYYAAPLATTVRPMLPPGLVRGIRYTLRPTGAASSTSEGLSPDAAMLLSMLHGRRAVEREQVSDALGMTRARRAIRALLDAGLAVIAPEAPASYARARRERLVRLVATEDMLTRWREEARSRLGGPVSSSVHTATQGQRRKGPEQTSERILSQLATLDALEQNAPSRPTWKIEELQRFTRVTTSGLAELADAGLIAIEEVAARRDPLAGRRYPRTQPLSLTAEQSAALKEILVSAETGGGTFLLHGVTGSGKTEVYLQALAAVIARGKQGIALVPEIALTPQAVARYAGRFPGRIALLHSGLSDGERLDEWRRIRAGEVDVVVGSRSALFAPVERLGLIIVDEEHEGAYKEERTPTYHARDVAAQLGALTGATVVLGSATPSAESYWRARQGIYKLIELRERVPIPSASPEASIAQLPEVTLIDLRAELRSGHTSILSEALQEALAETLARKEQAILFLNRRGTATSVVCRECGFMARCIRCDVAMTYHATEATLLCHYCGRREAPPRFCPVCGSASIRYFGVGSERVESAVKRQFPSARVLRWDRDTAKTRLAHEQLSQAFAERRADVLVGTQMIAKGLDLPAVTLVGVISADIALFLPDFRASERAFQLLTQVAGRAGRGERPGRVLVQTFNPEHFCIQAAARHDYGVFIEAELSARERYDYPPFRRFVKFTFEHGDRYTAQIEATALAGRLERLIADLTLDQADIVGPAPALLERLRGHYRWHVILRAPDPLPILHELTGEDLPPGWSVDIDPTSSV